MKVLVTGASGFVGSALCAHLAVKGYAVRGAVRNTPRTPPPGVEYRTVPDLDFDTNWREALAGINAVVHCAARVHIMNDASIDPLVAFREVNVKGTACLAEQTVDSGIKKFIYISSIKVNGEATSEYPFRPDDPPAPEDPYGLSKWEAEQVLQKIAQKTDLEVVIIRPPLVYGPGVRANFLRLMKVVMLGVPLPLGAIDNRRSMVALDNLIDLIETCLNHPAAVNQTFLASDGEDLSTRVLFQRTALALGRPARVIPVPMRVLWTMARLFGMSGFAQRLCGSLQVDISKTRKSLGWSPPVSVDESLHKTAKYFLSNRSDLEE
jgi:nucleoside-diphosphate-sugar epimerase